MGAIRQGWWLLAGLMACLATSGSLSAQTTPTPPVLPLASEQLSLELIDSRRAQVEQATDLDEETRKSALELYRTAADVLQRVPQLAKQRATLEAKAQGMVDRAESLRSELTVLKDQQPAPPKGQSLAQLEQELISREQSSRELRDEIQRIDQEIADRPSRRRAIRTRLNAQPQELAQITTQLDSVPPANEPASLTMARHTNLLVQKQLLEGEPGVLRAELALFDAEDAVELQRLQRELYVHRHELAEAEWKLAQNAVQQERERLAQAAVAVAKSEEVAVDPLLQELAKRNRELAQMTDSVARNVRFANDYSRRIADELQALERKYENAQRRAASFSDRGGLPASIGSVLRAQRSDLPDIRNHAARIVRRQRYIDDARMILFDLEEERSTLPKPEAELSRILAAEGRKLEDLPAPERSDLMRKTTDLLTRRAEFLDAVIREQRKYFDTMIEASLDQERIIQIAREFAQFIDENVLWIRSDASMLTPDAWSEGQWLGANLEKLELASTTVVQSVVKDSSRSPAIYVVFVILLALLVHSSYWMVTTINRIGEQVRRGSYTQFLPTLQVTLFTTLLAVRLPAILAFLAWRLNAIGGNDEVIESLADGCLATALVLGSLEFVRQLCRPNGLADAHFQWPAAAVGSVRRISVLLAVVTTPLVLVGETLSSIEPMRTHTPLERSLVLLGTIIYALAVSRLLHPNRGVFSEYLLKYQDGWLYRLRYVWYFAAIALPLSLGLLAILGYFYTAHQLAIRLFVMVLLMLATFVLYSLISRLILLQRRKLRIAQARQRQLAAMAEQEDSGATGPAVEDVPQVDLRDHSDQTRRFVAIVLLGMLLVGIWWTWQDVLPALGYLDRLHVWTSTKQISEFARDEAGQMRVLTKEVTDPVSVAEILLSLLIAIITTVAAKNLPGMLEIAVLQRLPIDNSVRYAITTLGRYLIVMFGVFIAFQTIGLRWSQIQWVATALTFGLAFGLQEMFANLVAGIIILFERPIRVGDIVTVDDVTGTVSRIRMRATTITNYDRKDYIVPNRDFITGRVLNWTLSDQVNRIVINVGVAYGSNTELVHETLLAIPQAHPLITEDPAPAVIFEEFSDSCLKFTVRCFIAMKNISMRLSVVNDIHMQIDAAFRKAKIEIAFPQRDLHIRSWPKELPSPATVSEPESVPIATLQAANATKTADRDSSQVKS